jgi:Sulfotransferase family
MSQGRMPDFFIAGHAKSGTTALYRMLKQHSQIYMPDVKEPWYFVPELRSPVKTAGDAKNPRTLDGYLSLFADATPEQRAGEATPSYLWSREAAARIAEAQPAAKVIAILREPASFLRSLHLQFLQTDVETESDLGKAIALEGRRREGKSIPRNSTRPQALLYFDHVRYAEQLRRYYDVFPAEQILVLIYDDFRADNDATVRQVLRFLDVDATSEIVQTDANPTVRVRSPRLTGLVRSLYMGRGPVARHAKAAIKRLTPRRVRHEAIAAGRRAQLGEPAPVDERLMAELRVKLKPEVVAVSEYLDRDLVRLWGYDSIG